LTVLGVLLHTGHWKAVTVAVKIIEHSEGSTGSASSGGKRISAGREMAVATNISHPNVVSSATSRIERHSIRELSDCCASALALKAHGLLLIIMSMPHGMRTSLRVCCSYSLQCRSNHMSLVCCWLCLQVQTYHISTMTVAQRNALAAAWLKDGGAGASSSNSAAHMVAAAAAARQASVMDEEHHSDSNNSNSSEGSYEEQSEALETWMVLEFCEKGTLQRALSQGRFKCRDSAQPDMVS
jgi:hypothetical protein